MYFVEFIQFRQNQLTQNSSYTINSATFKHLLAPILIHSLQNFSNSERNSVLPSLFECDSLFAQKGNHPAKKAKREIFAETDLKEAGKSTVSSIYKSSSLTSPLQPENRRLHFPTLVYTYTSSD